MMKSQEVFDSKIIPYSFLKMSGISSVGSVSPPFVPLIPTTTSDTLKAHYKDEKPASKIIHKKCKGKTPLTKPERQEYERLARMYRCMFFFPLTPLDSMNETPSAGPHLPESSGTHPGTADSGKAHTRKGLTIDSNTTSEISSNAISSNATQSSSIYCAHYNNPLGSYSRGEEDDDIVFPIRKRCKAESIPNANPSQSSTTSSKPKRISQIPSIKSTIAQPVSATSAQATTIKSVLSVNTSPMDTESPNDHLLETTANTRAKDSGFEDDVSVY
jgi:hypothetical protein